MKKSIAIFGGGPASLSLAAFLNPALFKVTIYEKNKTCGRKFLVAGKGGFNLTHSEPVDQLIKRYQPTSFLKYAIQHFSNENLRKWLGHLGIETFVGSSRRVFPIRGIKPVQVLDAILKHLHEKEVTIVYQKKWNGWSTEHIPIIEDSNEIKADYYVYGLGGASWKVTGSDGLWTECFTSEGINIVNFKPSNCAFKVEWPETMKAKLSGQPIKNVVVSCNGQQQQGELVITAFGLEGNAIYALSGKIREQLENGGEAIITIDFKPMFEHTKVETIINASQAKNNTDLLRNDLKLNKTHIAMIKGMSDKEAFVDRNKLSAIIKGLPVVMKDAAPIDEAISTVGGIDRNELSSHYELINKPGHFCIGEMVDWDAPTGGYLLQACFSMGAYLAAYLNKEKG